MPLNTPNLLTLFRMALIPVVVALYFMPVAGVYVTAGFLLAGLTDWLDGYLARRLAQTSEFGAFLDPVAANEQAHQDQAECIERNGGETAVRARGSFDNSPVPGESPAFRVH